GLTAAKAAGLQQWFASLTDRMGELADEAAARPIGAARKSAPAGFYRFAKFFQLADALVVDDDGKVVASATGTMPVGSDVTAEATAGSAAGRAVAAAFAVERLDEAVAEAARQGEPLVAFADFAPTEGEADPVAAFAAPFMVGDRKGVVVAVVPASLLAKEVGPSVNLGEGGEFLLIGGDARPRAATPRLTEKFGPAVVANPKAELQSKVVTAAVGGKLGAEADKDFTGRSVVSGHAPVAVVPANKAAPDGVRWAVVSTIDSVGLRTQALQSFFAPNALTALIALFTILVLIILLTTITRSITDQTSAITATLSELGRGNFNARVAVANQDELGELAESLNAMLDSTLHLIQSQSEREAIQDSIKRLLEEVSDVASGDLTVEAEVTNDFTGSIADAFNFMIAQLRELVSNVQNATNLVSSSAEQIQNATQSLSKGSETQSEQILETTTAITGMSRSMQRVAQNTTESAQVAEKARASAKRGTEAVRETVGGMDRIRARVQETAKRIKRLGESTQEIGEITQVIGDIADRTSILALNASIQAAMAGEAGAGFAVVAEEVERLAERSNNATKQISLLIKTIQGETAEAVGAMEESTREVVDGSRLAAQAGSALNEIEAVSDQLAELIRSVTQSITTQAVGAEQLTQTMNQIADVTKKTVSGMRNTSASVTELAQMADELRSSVSTFRLPGSVNDPTPMRGAVFGRQNLTGGLAGF
ncbi:MAG: methyl-accepting chemotaxis protein, partial [Planctomycetia bacterium]